MTIGRILFAHRATRAVALCLYLVTTALPAGSQPARSAVPPSADQPPRLALVIGNSKYESAGALRNPVNDARAVADVLREQGFEVIYYDNLGVSAFRRAIRDFTQRAQAEEGVALFYYAGHAVSMDGRNYLLPTDIRATDPDAISDDSIDVDNAILGRLDKSRKQFKILVLDSCRNNPFLTANTRGMKAGLAGIGSSGGTLIAFSTAPGRVAEDGRGDNSTFTTHLVSELRKGGEIEQVFKRVRIGVHNDTAGKQEPWVNASLNSNLYLRPAIDAAAPVAEAPVIADDEQKRILANIEIAEKKRDFERQRQYEERARDKARIESMLKTLSEELRRDRTERERLEQQQRRQMEEFTTRLASLQGIITETQQIGRGRALTQDESNRVNVALAETDTLKQQSASDANALQVQVDAARAREAQRRDQLAALVSQAERLSEPIAPQRPRLASDGTMFVRGVSLPKEVRIDAVAADTPPSCSPFQGAWSGRWDGLRTVELWIEKVDRNCGANVVYGRGGQSINVEPPKYTRAKGTFTGGELRIALDDGAIIRLRQRGDRQLEGAWTRDGRTVKAELRRIPDDPAVATTSFAQEDADFGAKPTRYLELPNPAKPLPLLVPGATTITTLELRELLEKDKSVVLIDAYRDADHMTIPGAWWRPDIGELRPGAFPLAEMAKMMQEITGRESERPVVVFERSANWGWYGYNAALRLIGMGYVNVYWYRGGIDAWFDAGFQMTKVSDRRLVAR